MKRLRHPVRAIREPFGTAGLVVAVVALVAAIGGTAVAANSALSGKQKKEVEKIAKKYAGAPGAPGANGTNGSNGAKGDNGAAGANGTNGSPGANGKSVAVTEIEPEEGKCEERAGAEVKPEGSAAVEVCDGANGAPGPQGEPWTAGGVLPAGATESGGWSFNGSEVNGEQILAAISFAIPLEAGTAPRGEHIHIQGETVEEGEETFEEACPGTPQQAEPGQLCIYTTGPGNDDALHNATLVSIGSTISGPPGAGEEFSSSPSGAILRFKFTGATGEQAHGYGSWAVTAPTP